MAIRITFILRRYANKHAEELKTAPSFRKWKRILALYATYRISPVLVKDQFDAFIMILIPIHAYHSRMEDVGETKIDLFERKIV